MITVFFFLLGYVVGIGSLLLLAAWDISRINKMFDQQEDDS